MGNAQAGIAFRIAEQVDDLVAMVADVFDDEAAEVAPPGAARFDTSNRSNVMVQLYGDICFIINGELVWPLVSGADDDAGIARVNAALGHPTPMIAFCRDDGAGRHGYAVFEQGRRIRTRLQTRGAPALPELLDTGEPLPFERRWLTTLHYAGDDVASRAAISDGARPPRSSKVDATARRDLPIPAPDLTGRLLQDGLETLFGVCPWQTLITPHYRFFRVGAAASRPGAGKSRRPPVKASLRRPWWPFR